MTKKPGPPLRDSHSAKAERILATARRLFAAEGFAATSMDAIVDEAKVSKSTIYNHYANKEALFEATVAQGTRAVADQMTLTADAAEAGHHTIEEELERLAQSYIRGVLDQNNLDLFRLVTAEAKRFPGLGRIFHQNVALNPWRSMRAALERARGHGQLAIEDCESATTQFLALVRADLQFRALLGVPADEASIAHTCREAVATFMARYRPI